MTFAGDGETRSTPDENEHTRALPAQVDEHFIQRLLAAQGFQVPFEDLLEIGLRYLALVEGLTGLEPNAGRVGVAPLYGGSDVFHG